MTDQPNARGRDLVLEELRRSYDRRHAALDSLDGHLWTIFTATGVVLTLAGAVKVLALQGRAGRFFWPLAIACAVVFAFQTGTMLWAIWPRSFTHPINWVWEELADKYFVEKPDCPPLDRLIADYLTSIASMSEANAAKSLAVRLGAVLFAVVATIVLLATWLSV